MKIFNKIKQPPLTLVWGVCLVLSVILRTYELVALTETRTGFMVRETEPVAYVLLILIGLLSALSAIFCTTVKTAFINPKLNLWHAAAAIALSVGIIADYSLNGYSGIPAAPELLCAVLQVVSAVYFIAYAFSFLFFKPFSDKLMIIPLVFFVVKTAAVFIRNSYHAVITDTIFDVVAYSFVMLFFLEYVRFLNGLGTKTTPQKTAMFGVLASSLCTVSALPKFLVSIFLSRSALHDNASSYILPLMAGIFIGVFTLLGIKPQKKHRAPLLSIDKKEI